tara:strand:+ start:76 stop:831 length:756 start_codon:yes stop_codon:yes gene_type:complete
MEVPGHPGYLIYRDGRISSNKQNTEKFLNVHQNRITFTYNYKRTTLLVHRLVAECYISNPDNLPNVSHINYHDQENNSVENLKWSSSRENAHERGISYIYKKTDHEHITKNLNGYLVKVNNTPHRSFKNKKDALCFKFIVMMKINADLYRRNRILKHKKHNWTYTSKIRAPPEGWISFFYGRYHYTNSCELCNIQFNSEKHLTKKCLDHHHDSGYMRAICCMKCNSGPLKIFDSRSVRLRDELHRYFNRMN